MCCCPCAIGTTLSNTVGKMNYKSQPTYIHYDIHLYCHSLCLKGCLFWWVAAAWACVEREISWDISTESAATNASMTTVPLLWCAVYLIVQLFCLVPPSLFVHVAFFALHVASLVSSESTLTSWQSLWRSFKSLKFSWKLEEEFRATTCLPHPRPHWTTIEQCLLLVMSMSIITT